MNMNLKGIKNFDPMIDSSHLRDIFKKFNQAKFVYGCHNAGIFDYLSLEPCLSETISDAGGFILSRLEVVLDALTGMALAQKCNERYALTRESYTFLCSRSPFYLGDLLEL